MFRFGKNTVSYIRTRKHWIVTTLPGEAEVDVLSSLQTPKSKCSGSDTRRLYTRKQYSITATTLTGEAEVEALSSLKKNGTKMFR